jgi:putative endonuclease
MPYKVYVLKSLSHANRYVGSSNDTDKRLKEHNQGKCRYTKGRRPWKLIYAEEFATRLGAMKREKFFKSGQGRKYLDEILKNK